MKLKNKNKQKIERYSEYIFEIRYEANPEMLDYRGKLTKEISDYMKFPEWRIEQDRIDVYETNGKNRIFVAFDKAGFTSRGVPTSNFFPDNVIKAFKYIFCLEGFGFPRKISRIGIRSKFYNEFDGSFKELCKIHSNKLLGITDGVASLFDAKLVNISGALSFEGNNKNGFNFLTNPVTKEQAKDLLKLEDGLYEVGTYLDIDCYKKFEEQITDKDIWKIIQSYSIGNWNKNLDICKLLINS